MTESGEPSGCAATTSRSTRSTSWACRLAGPDATTRTTRGPAPAGRNARLSLLAATFGGDRRSRSHPTPQGPPHGHRSDAEAIHVARRRRLSADPLSSGSALAGEFARPRVGRLEAGGTAAQPRLICAPSARDSTERAPINFPPSCASAFLPSVKPSPADCDNFGHLLGAVGPVAVHRLRQRLKRRGGMEPRVLQPALRELLEVRRMARISPKTLAAPIADVVDQNDEDVRRALRRSQVADRRELGIRVSSSALVRRQTVMRLVWNRQRVPGNLLSSDIVSSKVGSELVAWGRNAGRAPSEKRAGNRVFADVSGANRHQRWWGVSAGGDDARDLVEAAVRLRAVKVSQDVVTSGPNQTNTSHRRLCCRSKRPISGLGRLLAIRCGPGAAYLRKSHT